MKTRSLFCLFLFSCFFPGSSQDEKRLDSIATAISRSPDDTNKVKLCLMAHLLLQHPAPDSAKVYSDKALALSEKLQYKAGIAGALDNIGNYYNGRGSYAEALKHFSRALDVFEQLGRKRNMSVVCNSIGNTYLGINNDEKAVEYYQKSHDYAVEAKNKYAAAIADVGLSSVFSKKGQYRSALNSLFEAKSIFEERKAKYPVAVCLTNIGSAYVDLSMPDSALYYFESSLQIHGEVQNNYAIFSTLQLMGNVFAGKKEYKKALDYYFRSLDLAHKNGAVDNEKSICKNISDAYRSMGDFNKAYEYYVKFTAFKDSVFNSDSHKQLLEVQTKYETEKKDKEILVLNKDRQLKEAAISQARFIISAAAVMLLIVVIFALFMWRGYRIKKKTNRILQFQKNVIEEKNKSITDSIRYAKNIQEAILPEEELLDAVLGEHFIFFKPKDIVSGDFYWVAHKKDRFYFASVDCTGHGVPGAFMSMIGNTLLNELVNDKQITSTAGILFSLREGVIKSLKQSGAAGEARDGMDIALCCIHSNGQLEFSGANNPLWIIREGKCIEFKGDKQPIGIYSGEALSYTRHDIQLKKGDAVYTFTDGFADQFGGVKGKKFKYKQLQELLLNNFSRPMREQKELLSATYESWRGQLEQVDDILVIGVRI
ncbi:MAG: tetratricopeptide repeat protein [Bacteroidia bacterium]